MKNDLFEDITRALPDCQYISDLRGIVGKKNTHQFKKVLQSLHCDDYSVDQWNELIRYLFDIKETFENSQEAYKKICEYLNK